MALVGDRAQVSSPMASAASAILAGRAFAQATLSGEGVRVGVGPANEEHVIARSIVTPTEDLEVVGPTELDAPFVRRPSQAQRLDL
jgi:hypothetical protein